MELMDSSYLPILGFLILLVMAGEVLRIIQASFPEQPKDEKPTPNTLRNIGKINGK